MKLRNEIKKTALSLILVAVSSAAPAFGSKGTAAGPKIKIGFVLSTLQEERYQRDLKFFKEEAERLGFEAVAVSADNNEQTQTSKVENLLSMGVKALVVQPVNSEAAATLVKLAHDDKVPVVAYDRLISNAPVDFYVTQNSFEVGVLQAKAAVDYAKKQQPSKKIYNFVILKGQAGHSVANEITRGVHSVLDADKSVKIVVEKNHEAWSPSLAMATVENALTTHGNKIEAVLANNSGMAQGAVQALAEQGLTGKVFVAGADADLAAIKAIVNGRQQFEVLKDIAPLAKRSAQIAYSLARGEKPKPDSTVKSGKFEVPTVATPVYAVTLNNLEEKIFKTGFHSRESVYGR